MAEIRRNQRIVETVDPVTGETIYRNEVTGEQVMPDGTAFVPPAPVAPPATQVSERTVTQQTYPGTGQVVTQRQVVSGPATPVAPASMHTQETAVYSEDPYEPRRIRNFKLQQAIYLIFGIIEGLLAIRFVLRLLGANPSAGFASAIYGITRPFMWPFNGLFGTPSFQSSVVEFNAIVAIVVYALVAWLLVKVAWLVGGETRSAVRTSEVHRRIDQ